MPKRKNLDRVEAVEAPAGAGSKPPARRPAARVVTLPEPAPAPAEDDDEDVSSASTSGSGSGSDSDSEPDISSSDDGEAGDKEDSEDEDTYDDINVEFEFFDPKEADYLGLKALLHAYLDGQAYDSTGLVNAVINQVVVGTVVKTSEEDDPIALMTVLNTATHRGAAWMAELRAFLLAHCPTPAQRAMVTEALDKAGTGLLLHERLINSPPSLGPPLLQFLLDEVKDAATDMDDSTQAERDEFSLRRYLVCTRAYHDPQAEAGTSGGGQDAEEAGPSRGGGGGGGKKQKRKQAAAEKVAAAATAAAGGTGGAAGPPQQLIFVRPEDEFLHRQAAWSFTFPVENRPVSKGDLQPLRLVMCVEAAKVPAARRELDQVVGNMRDNA